MIPHLMTVGQPLLTATLGNACVLPETCFAPGRPVLVEQTNFLNNDVATGLGQLTPGDTTGQERQSIVSRVAATAMGVGRLLENVVLPVKKAMQEPRLPLLVGSSLVLMGADNSAALSAPSHFTFPALLLASTSAAGALGIGLSIFSGIQKKRHPDFSLKEFMRSELSELQRAIKDDLMPVVTNSFYCSSVESRINKALETLEKFFRLHQQCLDKLKAIPPLVMTFDERKQYYALKKQLSALKKTAIIIGRAYYFGVLQQKALTSETVFDPIRINTEIAELYRYINITSRAIRKIQKSLDGNEDDNFVLFETQSNPYCAFKNDVRALANLVSRRLEQAYCLLQAQEKVTDMISSVNALKNPEIDRPREETEALLAIGIKILQEVKTLIESRPGAMSSFGPALQTFGIMVAKVCFAYERQLGNDVYPHHWEYSTPNANLYSYIYNSDDFRF